LQAATQSTASPPLTPTTRMSTTVASTSECKYRCLDRQGIVELFWLGCVQLPNVGVSQVKFDQQDGPSACDSVVRTAAET
jgi:hypothetical protein